MTDVFREVRERVPAIEAARYYGLEIKNSGKACCPFHHEKTPSLGFKGGRFKCFGCGVSGDSIDYVARLLGLAPLEAAKRINTDFRLGLPLDRHEVTEAERQEAQRRRAVAEAHKAFEAWRESFILRLCHAIRAGNGPEATPEALRMRDTLEYWCDTLSYGTPQDQMQIYKEREAVNEWIEKVLSS